MRRRSLVNVLAGLLLANIGPAAQGMDLVTPGATLERLATGFGFVEGPAADSEGGVYFSDIPSDRIHRWTPETGVTTVREQTGRANGLRFDAEGNLLVCEMDGRRITSIDQHGVVSILADELDGHQFNSPDDLWVTPNGGIYFSDPWYGPDGNLEMGGEHVYYISPDRQEVRQVTDDLVRPTGIIGTADGTRLYIADQGAGRTYVYTPAENGTLTNKRLFVSQGSDGMTMDERDNVYVTGPDIMVYNPRGEPIASIAVPEPPANLTFGGPDRTTLFITARTSIYALEMAITGQ